MERELAVAAPGQAVGAGAPDVAAAWDVALGHSLCATLETALEREWLVTNGIGGYAMGALCGTTTRRYHGLLVAALRPPVARTVLLTKVDEDVLLPDGQSVALGTNEYADGTIAPSGYGYLDTFALEGAVARFRFRLPGGAMLEKRVWMEHGRNTTYVRYLLTAPLSSAPDAGAQPYVLTLTPFCVCRDYHTHTHAAPDQRFLVDPLPGGCVVRATADAPACWLLAGPAATFAPVGQWFWHVLHRCERERGLDDTEDVYQPGTLRATLHPGATLTLVASAADDPSAGFGGPDHEAAAAAALERDHARTHALLARAQLAWRAAPLAAPLSPAAPAPDADDTASSAIDAEAPLAPILARLALAADQFIVARSVPGPGGVVPGGTVIAGYPWFTDWGRDTMIALAGLALPTGRPEVARDLLRTFARFLDRGMLPNRFPDGGEPLTDADYNTADATLWYFVALDRYLRATGDRALLGELFPALAEVIAWHQRGTRFGIGVDPRDGLLRAGAPGVQLTWMDAKVGDWVVTPRRGKPVEINGLWHHALALMAEWAAALGQPPAAYAAARDQAAASFAARFWHAAAGCLADVVDVAGADGATDASLRPNQVIALALRSCPIPDDQAHAALDVVERHLLAPLGLRTLSPDDPAFQPRYTGDQRQRDAAYHQGTIWPWLIGPYLDARLRLAPDPATARQLRAQLLAPFRDHLLDAGLGSISEILEAVPPFRPVGCVAQAWSVAEVLRAWTGIGG